MQLPRWYLIVRTTAQLVVGASAILFIIGQVGDLQSARDAIVLILLALLGIIAVGMGILGIASLVAQWRDRPLPFGLTWEHQEWLLERDWWIVLVAILLIQTIWW